MPPFQRTDALLEYLKKAQILEQGLTVEIISDVHDTEILKDEYAEVFPEE